ncbi:indolepyruvate oxidoreductase subunit beta [Lutibacter maritimus]|jgi:indolepyruvate ferredoxin oxidoreductase beta subunit|uniref:Indolepyruvate ferredoxin oxidoreductase beta subunit n=1 Tax=Lutibacter maritimus TaxID=593133 RepID=A0A1I6S3F3_9FLAO|nr:indolepyruvate oxidoreductase subunit beta [Lutibacter maritimus]SFS71268.1 indolepyruvate ferredoxin oxidoreductase beta subunit [Lutibacter maritimus]
MKTNIILAGVGGQGILTIAAVLDTAALDNDLNIKQSEVHGMSQRGGAVQSHVRISDKEIFSDLIPQGKADLIISVEPMELLRYLPFLKEDGFLVTDSNPFVNITNYPELEDLYKEIKSHKNNILIDAKQIAKDLGNSKATNMVLLGAVSSLLPLSDESLQKAIKTLFERKGEKIVAKNLEAYEKGKEVAVEFIL